MTLALMGAATAAAAADGMWSAHFWGERKCDVIGQVVDEQQFFSIAFSWSASRSVVELSMADFQRPSSQPSGLSVQSPSLETALPVKDDLVGYQSGPGVQTFRRDIAAGASWRLIARPKRRKEPVVFDVPPSNGRTQMAMFEACIATTARVPNIPNETNSPRWQLDATGEAAECSLKGSYEVGGDWLELLMHATRSEFSTVMWIPKPEVAAGRSIDLSALGGPRAQPALPASFTVAAAPRRELLARLAGDAPVSIVVTDAAGASQSIRLVEPQDVVEFAMFRGCVEAIEGAPAP